MQRNTRRTGRVARSLPGQRTCGYVLGAVYVGLGTIGFAVTGGLDLASTAGAELVGLELNPLQNGVHIGLGGLLLGGALSGGRPSRATNVLVGTLFAALTVAGLFVVGTDANVFALNQADNALHAASAALVLILGSFVDRRPDEGRPPRARRGEEAGAEPSRRPGQPIIEARGLVKTYMSGRSEMRALRGAELEVAPGQMVAVVGPSGSGKTTLLNCLSGLDEVDSGQVVVGGRDIAGLSDRQRTTFRRRSMGFVFQAFNLVPVFSAAENVELPLLVDGVAPDDARRRAERILSRVGLGDRLDHRPAELSGGEQQRVAVARALAPDPLIVWSDEPTGNLDSVTAESVMELLEELNDDGLTVVLVTHDMSVADRADRVLTMRDGVIVGDEVSV